MTITDKPQLATESGHYYDAKTGEPRYTIIGANGNERNTTLRDAKKFGYVPSVTEILKCAHKPALDSWKQKQILLAALTLPRLPSETDEAFAERVIEDSQAQAKAARERGTVLHGAIERAIQDKQSSLSDPWRPHVLAVYEKLQGSGIDLFAGDSERSFAHPLGYGGKIDFSTDAVVADFKNKPRIEDGKEYAYDEHCGQLIAYAQGLGRPAARLLSVFVGCEDAKVQIREWTRDESNRCWLMFRALLDYWKAKSRV